MADILTQARLAAFAPHCDAELLAPAIRAAAAERGIDTPLRLGHWLAQFAVETMGLTVWVENLNYSAKRLCEVWPGRFPNLIAAYPFDHNPERLAERVYGGRMGNDQPGDGWTYRGRGAGLTGKANYRKYGAMIGLDLVAEPDKAGWPVIAPRIAAAFWADHDLNSAADRDDIEAVTRAWNGGLTGLAEREAALARAKAVLGVHAP